MTNITTMMIGEYKKRLRNDNGLRLVPPEIPIERVFELKGNILSMLKDIPFFRKEYEDALNNIDEVLDISNYFNVPNVSRDTVLLRLLPVKFIGDTKIWLKSLAPRTIRTCDNLRESFFEQFSSPSKIFIVTPVFLGYALILT